MEIIGPEVVHMHVIVHVCKVYVLPVMNCQDHSIEAES